MISLGISSEIIPNCKILYYIRLVACHYSLLYAGAILLKDELTPLS